MEFTYYDNQDWDLSFEGLDEDVVRKWLWLQGEDESQAGDVTRKIVQGWKKYHYHGGPQPLFVLHESSIFVYFNMPMLSIYTGIEMTTYIKRLGEITDWIESLDNAQ